MKSLISFHICNPNEIHYIYTTSPDLMDTRSSHKRTTVKWKFSKKSWSVKASVPAFVDPNKGANLPPEVPRSLFEPLFKPDRAKKLSFKHHWISIFLRIQTFLSWNINDLFVRTRVHANICDCLESLHRIFNAWMKVFHF